MTSLATAAKALVCFTSVLVLSGCFRNYTYRTFDLIVRDKATEEPVKNVAVLATHVHDLLTNRPKEMEGETDEAGRLTVELPVNCHSSQIQVGQVPGNYAFFTVGHLLNKNHTAYSGPGGWAIPLSGELAVTLEVVPRTED